ncbi:UNVERIFIED_CONTAM: hypothetical protein Sradi_1631700 [Sesamum radiatum]|uniref:Uncharacterized protein n=1 Tax=Sesamum radiatum TaxID=300843 RepID=A0AAW2UDB2_SESRA
MSSRNTEINSFTITTTPPTAIGSPSGSSSAAGATTVSSPTNPQPLREPKTPRLEHLRPVPAQPPAATFPLPLQRCPRPRIPPLPRSVRKNQGPHSALPLLRATQPARTLPLSPPPGLGQP